MDEFLAQRAIGRVFVWRIAVLVFEGCADRGLAENQLAMNARDLAFICQMNMRLGEVSLDCKCQQCDEHQKARGGKAPPLAYADPGVDSSHCANNTPMHPVLQSQNRVNGGFGHIHALLRAWFSL